MKARSRHSMITTTPFTIVITDLNHNIRDLLYRELADERFNVSCINTGPEVYHRIMKPDNTDVVILDPEMLSPYGSHLLENVFRQECGPIIILHTYQFVDENQRANHKLVYIEKNENSIDTIVEIIKQWRVRKTEP